MYVYYQYGYIWTVWHYQSHLKGKQMMLNMILHYGVKTNSGKD